MSLNFDKLGGILPAVIQDAVSREVLMLGFMNAEAYDKTLKEGRVCFYSRSKERLWIKGEESGNYLDVVEILEDCDKDTLLIRVNPAGPVCHTGKDTCFEETNRSEENFLFTLEKIIEDRKKALPEGSYTTTLFKSGLNKITQKVGEETTEVIIAALNQSEEQFKNEVSDLIYHLLVLLQAKEVSLSDINTVLYNRHHPK